MKKSTIIIWAEIALVFIVVAAVYVHLSGHSKVSSVDDDYPYSPEWTVVEKIDKPFTNIHIAYSSGHLQKHGSDYTSANYKNYCLAHLNVVFADTVSEPYYKLFAEPEWKAIVDVDSDSSTLFFDFECDGDGSDYGARPVLTLFLPEGYPLQSVFADVEISQTEIDGASQPAMSVFTIGDVVFNKLRCDSLYLNVMRAPTNYFITDVKYEKSTVKRMVIDGVASSLRFTNDTVSEMGDILPGHGR